MLLDGEIELEDHIALGKRRQLTAIRLSPAAVEQKAKERMLLAGTATLQRARKLASQSKP